MVLSSLYGLFKKTDRKHHKIQLKNRKLGAPKPEDFGRWSNTLHDDTAAKRGSSDHRKDPDITGNFPLKEQYGSNGERGKKDDGRCTVG